MWYHIKKKNQKNYKQHTNFNIQNQATMLILL